MKDNSTIKKIVLLVLVTKILLLAVPYLSFRFLGFRDFETYDKDNFIYPANESLSWVTSYKTWDANFYLYVADHGYGHERSSRAFLPLYPFLIALLKKILNGNGVVAGLVLSHFFSFLGFLFLFKLVEKIHNTAVAFQTVTYAIVFPTSFFFTRIYSEALFFFLVVFLFYCLAQGHYKRVILIGVLLSLTKVTGILLIFPLAIHFWLRIHFQNGQGAFRKDFLMPLLAVVAPAIGCGMSMFVMYLYSGNWFASFEAQRFFISQYSAQSIFDLYRWLRENFLQIKLSFYGTTNNVFDRLAFFFFLVFLWQMYRRRDDKAYFYYALLMGLIPALSDHFMSYTRYLIVVFPLYLQLALNRFHHKTLQTLMFACQLILAAFHSLGYWVA